MATIELKAGGRFTGLDLSEVDWTDRDLLDLELTDCTITDAQFSGAMLQGARFKACRFVRCRFAHADLREAKFEDCIFTDDQGHVGAQFAFCRMDEGRFRRCDLSFARFERSTLYGIEMEACNLRGAAFVRADFSRAFGRKVVKCSAALKGCNLELADLTQVRLADCDLNRSNFREAVLVEYPRRDSWTIAFVTGRPSGEVASRLGEAAGPQHEFVSLYVPTTPNPTSGFFLMAPRADVRPLGMSVDEALKYIISMGVVAPPSTPH